jgi:hypothetical protein
MLRPFAVSAAVLAASASAADAQNRVRARVNLPAWRSSIVMDTLALRNREPVNAPIGPTYSHVVAVVKGLEPELAAITDSVGGMVGALAVVAPRRIANQPPSRLLDCGVGMTGRYADTHRLTLAFVVFLDPLDDGRTQLGFAFTASALERGGSTNGAIQCNTTGALEAMVLEAVRKRAGLNAP